MTLHPYTRFFILPSAPTVDEDETEGYEAGDVVLSGGSFYDCSDASVGAAVWTERSAGLFDLAAAIHGATGGVPALDDEFVFWGSSLEEIAKVTYANLLTVIATYLIDSETWSEADHGHAGLVTGGDDHDHDGGDGAPIAYSSLSGTPTLPAAETNTADIYSVSSPGGPSLFTATINGAPSGTSVTYNAPSAGTEAAIVPVSTSQLGKMRLYNTTRGNSALISNVNTGTNVITLTATVPGTWANGDTITIVSQTVSGGGLNWVDIEITSGPTGRSAILMNFQINSATVNDNVRTHPFDGSFSASKYTPVLRTQVTSVLNDNMGLQKIISNVFSLSWTGTPTSVTIREAGYLS